LSEAAVPLLEIDRLSVHYPAAPAPVLRRVSLALPPDGTLGVVGESGVGKSTLALAIMGLLPAGTRCEGSICFRGEELLGHPERARALRWRCVSLVLQEAINALNPVLTIGEQLAEVWVVHAGLSWRAALQRAAAAVARVGLEEACVHHYPHELSGGMRQRVAIAMALALSPALVIVDEPTSALDVLSAGRMIDMLRALRRDTGAACLVISHDLSVIARTCAQMMVLERGQVCESGGVSAILRAPAHRVTRQLIEAFPTLPARKEADAAACHP